MVRGAVGSRPYCVPHSTTLWSLAASISIAALRMPEVISSFSLGRAANSVRGKRRALAHRADDLKILERAGGGLGRGERLVEDRDVDTVRDLGPVCDRHGQVEIVVENCTAQPRHWEGPFMARVTAGMGRQRERHGRAQSRTRASGLIALFSAKCTDQERCGRLRMLGAPGRSRSAHIMQFGPVGVERLGDELTPEGAEFGEGPCETVAAVRRGGKGCRSDRCHDAGPLFSLAAFAA